MDSRRRLFRKFGSLGLASLPLRAAPSRIIDTHTHFYDPARSQGVPWPPKSDSLLYRTTLPPDFKKVTAGLGITGTVVVEASAWLDDNQWILDLAKNEPVIKGFVGNLDINDAAFAQNLERLSKNALFRGIRLNGKTLSAGAGEASFLGKLERLAGLDLSLDAVGDGAMLAPLVTITQKVRSLRIIVDHLPYDLPPDSPARRSLDELARQPQVFIKVSNVLRRLNGHVSEDVNFYRPSLDALWTAFGADRLVYGSNWPVSNKVAPYPAILKVVREYFASKGQDAEDKYFFRNSQTVYKWIQRG